MGPTGNTGPKGDQGDTGVGDTGIAGKTNHSCSEVGENLTNSRFIS